MSRRDLGSLFDEEGQGATPAPSEAPRARPVDELLINDEARQMLEERSRAAREAAARAAEVAAQKGKELGKAALGALGRMKEERRRKTEEKAALAKEKARQEAFDLTMAAPMSVSVQVTASADENRREAMLEGLTSEDVRGVLADPGVREAAAPFVYDGMGQLPSELRPVVDMLVVGQPVPAVGQGGIGMATVPELIPAPTHSYKRIALIGAGVLVLAALGGAAYWWSNRPIPTPVSPPKIEAAPITKPVIAPAPVPVVPPSAPVVEPVVAPAPIEPPVVDTPVVEREPEPMVAAAPEPTVQAPAPQPAQIKPRPKKVEVVQPSQAPKQEEQQIEQIRDFGKQLEELGKR